MSEPLPTFTEIAIVGAGAAGLATGVFAGRAGARDIAVLDGAARPGAKILVSGGSRCNVTNVAVSERDFRGGRSAIVKRVLRALPVADTVAFFEGIRVPLVAEPSGKLFPRSNRSRDVLDALLAATAAAGARLFAHTRVTGVRRAGDGFILTTSRGDLCASSLVLATGGMSLPKTGSDGGGYALAASLGHTIVDPVPALVPLLLDAAHPMAVHAALSGVSQEVEIAAWIDGRIAERIRGALLWTHFGISGPAVLDVSRTWARATHDGRAVRLTANLLPGETFESLDRRLVDETAERPRATLRAVLARLLPASTAEAVLIALGLAPAAPLATLERADRRRLVRALIEWPLPVTGTRGYNYAEVTSGGVALDEIDPGTMESRRVPGLYLVGEILDVDGRIGGFNFQWAWATAHVAGAALARLR